MKIGRFKNLNHRVIWTQSMIGMTWGFIASLVVGTIIGLFGLGYNNSFSQLMDTIKKMLTYITGFAIGIGIGIKLKLSPLQILATAIGCFITAQSRFHPFLTNGTWTWTPQIGMNVNLGLPGDVFAAWISGVLWVYFFKIFRWEFHLDIILVPFIGVVIGVINSFWLIYLTSTATKILEFIIYHSANKEYVAGILLAPMIGALMGLALSLPTSSAAIAISIKLQGVAATAAMAGTAGQMIAFGVLTFLSTKSWSKAVAVGLGTSMLQLKNFGQRPRILIIPTLVSAFMALLAVTIVPLTFEPVSVTSGMGSCALYGQIFTLVENGWSNSQAWINVLVMQLVGPLILTLGLGWIVFRKQIYQKEWFLI